MGGCYAALCCDCNNAREFSKINSKSGGNTHTCFSCGKKHRSLIDGKTKTDQKLSKKIHTVCNNKKYCEFTLGYRAYGRHSHSPISKSYKVEIGYYCKNNGRKGSLLKFNDYFDHSNEYMASISCEDSLTTRNEEKCCDPTSAFKAAVCGGVTCGIVETVLNVCPVTTTISSIASKLFCW
ncbi:MAG: hypothetical protein HRT87_08180 [Legionellales bacterium]|nr:hypothetical protein [Legionellales bacterium]